MSFKVVVRERDDSDFDVVGAIQCSDLQDELNYSSNQFIEDLLFYMNKRFIILYE